ncbi:ExeA family protein [Noviherbaspirillum sedimenti]|uniref:AAA family ATPase n=1 Tax=Noviherbaspirillum sedimenti TaxID=2320865 RepID=A0A3A3G6E0_9BURK|nr:ExeA family protein [Noviherbaspirillum sedimenti]RJG04097.1 AAA family ATPase [Noviherbaspirillum sedimenti]
MYTQFFQLKQAPFSIAPDPRYLFMSERHREALAHLLYGVGSGGGFVLLTGEIGAGKTTVCRCLLEQIPENCHVAYIFNPKLSVGELLQSICEEFRIDTIAPGAATATIKTYVDALNAYLLRSHAEGKNSVLIIDEAQNLAPDVLEQLRLLTNLETNERKLLQVILIGQPELRAMLARPELEQLGQRVIARYHLDALSPQETASYILHRMSISGATAVRPFAATLMPKIHRLTRGVPRRINLLCDRALLGAYAASRTEVTPAILAQAAREVFGTDAATSPGRRSAPTHRQRWRLGAAGAVGALLSGAIGWAWQHGNAAPDPAIQAVLAAHAGSFKLSHSLATDHPRQRPGAASGALSRPRTATPQSPLAADMGGVLGDTTRDETSAFRLLGQLWGMALGPEDPCAVARSRNVHCHRSTGGLAELRRLHRPAILKLRDDKLASHHVLLVGLSDTTATLRTAGIERDWQVGLKELAQHFQGEFVTFWRAPPGYSGKIGPDDKGQTVDWLNGELSRLHGGLEAVPGQPYGDAMARQMRQFQKAHGLQADGIAGARTLMFLNDAAGIPEPRLHMNQALAAALPGE